MSKKCCTDCKYLLDKKSYIGDCGHCHRDGEKECSGCKPNACEECNSTVEFTNDKRCPVITHFICSTHIRPICPGAPVITCPPIVVQSYGVPIMKLEPSTAEM
jgi:hypothetical protein